MLFTSSLLRKNLTYKVIFKDASPDGAFQQLANYILESHEGDTGE